MFSGAKELTVREVSALPLLLSSLAHDSIDGSLVLCTFFFRQCKKSPQQILAL